MKMKRFLSLLLAVVMIMSFIPPVHVHAADDCFYLMHFGSHQYGSYTDNEDGTHSQKCQGCDETKTDNHTYGNWTNDSRAGNHYRKCTNCNAKETADHTMGYKQGSYGAGYHVHGCTVCSYTEGYGQTQCKSDTWLKTDAEHYKKCDTCGLEFARESHSGSVTNNGASGHTIGCSTCGKGVTEPHDMGDWVSDSWNNQHKRTCKDGCGYTETASHDYTKYTGTDGQEYHTVSCKVCGASNGTEYCTLTGSYVQGETQHWKVCSVCNTAGRKTTHSGDTTNNGASGHTIGCSTCGKGVTEPHDMGDWTSDSWNNQHKRTCKDGCGYTETASHDYTKYTGTDGQEYHTVSCKVCGASNGTENCTLTGSYVKGETQHWKVCSLCKTKGTMTDHSGTVTDWDDEGHTVACSTCGDGGSKPHELTGWKNDSWEGNHYRECTVNGCDYKETGEHGNWTYEQYSSDRHLKKCGTCSYSEYEDCDKSYTDNKDGKTHTVTCDNCEYTNNKENHKFDSATKTCDCGAVKHDHKWKLTANGNKITLTCEETIGDCIDNLGELTISAPANLTYDGNAKTATVEVTSGSYMAENGSYTVSYQYKSGSSYYTASEVKNAGDYRATVTYRLNNGAYEKATVDFTVQKAKLTVTADDRTEDYDGNAYGIEVKGLEGTGLKVYFGDSETSCNNTTYTKTDAGEYEIFYEVRGDYFSNAIDNYDITGKTGSAKLTINAANLADVVKVTPYSGTYDGKAHGITVTAPSDADVYYSADGETWTSWPNQNITYTDVGTYTVHYKVVSESGNYTTGKARAAEVSVVGSSTVEIDPLDLATVVTAEDAEFTYNRSSSTDGIPHSIKVSVGKTPDTVTVEYSTDGGETWVSEYNNPKFTNAGTYPVKYRVYVKDQPYSNTESENYKKTEGEKTVIIRKADLPITELVGYHGPYDGSTHYGFGYKYTTSYGSYFTTYYYNYLHEELNYSFSWNDENGTAKTLEVEAGEEPKLTDFPGFTKQNVVKVDSSKDTDASYGAHKVTVTIGSDNYNDKAFTYYVQIGPGGAIAEDRTFPYDGTEHYIANYIAGHLYYWGYGEVYNSGSIKIEYRVNKEDPTYNGNDAWLPYNQEPGQTNVGSKLVDWRVTMDSDQNGKFGEEENSFGSREVFIGTNRVTVEPKPVTILIDEDKNITVDENDLVNGDTCEIDTITYYKDGQEVTDITAPGTYTAVVTLKNGNYVSENNVEFTVENPVTYYKVEFNMQLHGEQVPEQNITAGGKATKPTDPTAAGYTFGGWYTDEKCTTAYDFNAAVTGNMTLYAKWTETSGSEDPIPAKFKVTFDVRGHGTAPADQTVEQGAKAEKPADPIAANYTFGGWYTDKDCTIAYVFDTEVENNITLYAKWTKTIYKVTYDANGGTGEMPVVNVEAGEGHTLVANEFKAPTGKTFKCWKVGLKEYKAGEKIDVTENVTVKAVWKNKTASSDLDYVPAAGDNFPTFLWAGLLLFSVVALVEVVVLRRKRS